MSMVWMEPYRRASQPGSKSPIDNEVLRLQARRGFAWNEAFNMWVVNYRRLDKLVNLLEVLDKSEDAAEVLGEENIGLLRILVEDQLDMLRREVKAQESFWDFIKKVQAMIDDKEDE